MEQIEIKQYLIAALAGVALVACCLVFFQIGKANGYQRGYNAAMNEPHKADTVWRRDTIRIDHPVEVERWREKTVYLAVHDTQIVHTTDSVFVALERESRRYSGDDYQAVVSGVLPSLDEIKVFPKTAYITNTVVEKRRWSFGISVGPGVVYDGSFHGGVGAVAGLQYNF